MELPKCLEDYQLQGLPQAFYYIPNFISDAEEEFALNKIDNVPKPRWTVLSHRRLQTWPSALTNNTLLGEPLPEWLQNPVISRLNSIPVTAADAPRNIFSDSPHNAPNHVLINEYQPGQGIMPHKDGAAYHPVVCTVSLGSSLCLDIYGTKGDGTIEDQPKWKILQEPRSLLITTGDAYTGYLHGIAEVTHDQNLNEGTVANWALLGAPDQVMNGGNERQARISLTYRDVLKVSKLGGKLFGAKR